jgi:hypothetical protein
MAHLPHSHLYYYDQTGTDFPPRRVRCVLCGLWQMPMKNYQIMESHDFNNGDGTHQHSAESRQRRSEYGVPRRWTRAFHLHSILILILVILGRSDQQTWEKFLAPFLKFFTMQSKFVC